MPYENADRGAKHRCFQCQTAFYDLKRPKLVCPRCGADPADEAKLKPAPAKKSRKAAAPVPPPKPVAEEVESEEDEPAEAVSDDADDDDDLDEPGDD